VFTDKLVAKIPSTATGVVKKINFGDDEVCPVGHSLFTIELDDGETVEVETPAQKEQEVAQAPTCGLDKNETAPPGNSSSPLSKALSTPAVRFIAKKEGIDINKVTGTGRNGRVTKTDLLDFMAGKTMPDSAPATQQSQSAATVSRHHTIAPLTGTTEFD
jgi:2-oxoisovalerate dehydrogenase E2 component (dihydrolipoyl transacylase)